MKIAKKVTQAEIMTLQSNCAKKVTRDFELCTAKIQAKETFKTFFKI